MPVRDCSKLIREIRKRLGISQEQLARELDISFQTVNRWENAKANPSRMGMKLLKAKVCGMGKHGEDLLGFFSPLDQDGEVS
jgi:DNA-binding transcriptional regulator YiaG